MSKEKISSVRGMRTIYGAEALQYEALFEVIHEILHTHAYQPMHLPLLEKTRLFQRAVGEETDVVSKEMYTFNDRNDESLTLRPEATAGVVRAMIENGLLQQPQRVYAEGPMFRYERPQEGRYRQFYQVSVEAFGSASPVLDVELIGLCEALFQRLNIREMVTLEINTIGLAEERKKYQEALVTYLAQHQDKLDADSQRRLTTNPLRILDSKDPQTQALLNDAPILDDYLGEGSRRHFAEVCDLLRHLNIPFKRNSRLVRGLDYYNHTVFEWTTEALGAQGTITAGGRYDGLVEQLGGAPTPAMGFAFGVDRIALLAQKVGALKSASLAVYAMSNEMSAFPHLLTAVNGLRAKGLSVYLSAEATPFKKQFAKADKSGAEFVLLVGEDEVKNSVYTLKNLRDGQQKTLNLDELLSAF